MIKKKAFTLVELLIVIVILGILVLIALPFYFNIQRSAVETSITAEVRNYKLGQLIHHKINKNFATSTAELETIVVPEGFEPTHHDVVIHATAPDAEDYCVVIYESSDTTNAGKFCYYATANMPAGSCTSIGAGLQTQKTVCNFDAQSGA